MRPDGEKMFCMKCRIKLADIVKEGFRKDTLLCSDCYGKY